VTNENRLPTPVPPEGTGQLVLYRTQDGQTRINVRLIQESVWLTLNQIGDLFQRDKRAQPGANCCKICNTSNRRRPICDAGDRILPLMGQLFKVLGFARRPASQLISSFADWLKRGYPWLLAGLAPLRTDRIVDFRNREDHSDVRLIETHEAEEASRICRDAINPLHPR